MNANNSNYETKRVKIDSLITENLQIRLKMVEDTIEHYAAIYRDTPDELPPVTVFYNAMLDTYYLADGFHRLAATRRNESETILAEVHEGTEEDALRFAIQANAENALQRTKADMIHAMEIIWDGWDTLYEKEPRTTEDGKPSVRQLKELCGVTLYLANIFAQKKRVFESNTPHAGKASGDIAVPEISDDAPERPDRDEEAS